MTQDSEPRYTLDEAKSEMARRECAYEGHRPLIEISDVDSPVGAWLCACHTVTWVPQA